jgi:hypothetical protein
MKENTAWRLNTSVQVDFWVGQWHRDEFQNLFYARIYPAQVR